MYVETNHVYTVFEANRQTNNCTIPLFASADWLTLVHLLSYDIVRDMLGWSLASEIWAPFVCYTNNKTAILLWLA